MPPQESLIEDPRNAGLVDLGDKLFISLDPGAEHVGYAVFCTDSGLTRCALAEELTPDEAMWRLTQSLELGQVWHIGIESFTLDSGVAAAQFGKEMTTPEMIGACKWVARYFKVPITVVSRTTKTAMRNQLRARNIKRKSYGSGVHALDAELIGYVFLFQERQRRNAATSRNSR